MASRRDATNPQVRGLAAVQSSWKSVRQHGVCPLCDHDARSALTEAMGQYYGAIHSHALARLAVRKAIGTLAVDASAHVTPSLRLERDPL